MTKELIAEARAWAPCAMSPTGQLKLITRLADALEAATRDPVQGEPNDDEPTETQVEAAAKALNALAVENNGTDDWEDWTVEARTALVAAQGAETEELRADVMTAEEAIESVLKRPGMYGLVDKEGHRSMKAARDAALAAVERGRAIHKPKGTGRTEYVLDGRGGITGTEPTFTCPEGCMASAWFFEGQECDTYKALAGAPEPDNDDPCDAEVHSWDHFRPERIDSYWIRCTLLGKHDEHEDSHTGLKWGSGLPVEGERP